MGKRVLVGVPVRQTPAILSEFLRGLSDLDTAGIELAFFFLDNNAIEESSALLQRFQQEYADTTIEAVPPDDDYLCDDAKHHWNDSLVWKVAHFKDRMVHAALEGHHDFLFLVDSDVVLPPQLLRHLVTLDKPVVSEVYWTSWSPNSQMLPQVWLRDQYSLFTKQRSESLTKDDEASRAAVFVKALRRPGVYRVGGLGGCTLMARAALARGLSFAEIDNVSLWGEDRHFCLRARANGVELWADTRYPPLHLYRAQDLARVPAYRARFDADFLAHPKLTLSMVVRNEASRWLRDALRAHRGFIHEAVIVDDASTDNTVDVIRRELDGVPVRLVRNAVSRFANEIQLRRQQWDESLASNPDWLLVLDADEILEPAAATVIPEILDQTDYGLIGLPLYDFWNATHYREDQWWNAHKTPRPFLVRYTPDFLYRWNETVQHCGRMPANLFEFNTASIDLRVKHMGWATAEEREQKHARYLNLDPDARYGVAEQYTSILDLNPNLVAWQDQP
jgi:hypothetical protein